MKRLLLSLLFCLFVSHSFAQAMLDKPELYIGATAGAIAAQVNFNPVVEQKLLQPQLGVNAGVAFRYNGNRNVGVQVELNYLQRGWKENITGYERRLDYLEIPFLTHIYFGKKFRGQINLGPKIGLLIAEMHKNLPAILQPQHHTADNKFDYGLCGGIGMQLNTRAGSYQLEARFGYSLGNVFSTRKADFFNAANSMNLSLNFGWFWQLKQ